MKEKVRERTVTIHLVSDKSYKNIKSCLGNHTVKPKKFSLEHRIM